MFKILTTLVRGRSAEVLEGIGDANAIAILKQQIRDASAGVISAQQAVAVVMAYQAREQKTHSRLETQMGELEQRAIAALEKGEEQLASEAAGRIAELEQELASSKQALDHYSAESTKLREQLSLCQKRLRELQRGKQLVDAAERTQKLSGSIPNGALSSLREAEATLERLKQRHEDALNVETALTELDVEQRASSLVSRLADAGCGAPVKSDASNVLKRLRQEARL